MAAECYWCKHGGAGSAGDPLGCCRRCQAFACDQHASYDTVVLEYVCATCHTAALTGSALVASSVGSNKMLTRFKGAFPDLPGDNRSGKFRDLQEFQSRMPGYSNYFQLMEDNNNRVSWGNAEIDRELQQAGPAAKGLYIAAAVLMAKLPFPADKGSRGESAFPNFLFMLSDKIADQ